MSQFQVIDLRTTVIDAEAVVVEAHFPEHAAEIALGPHLVRSGARRDLQARVYYKQANRALRMVRVYSKIADRVPS